MKYGIWVGRIPESQKTAWAFMPFRGSLAHHWIRCGDGLIKSSCGMFAMETKVVGLIQAEGADRCKNCERRVKP